MSFNRLLMVTALCGVPSFATAQVGEGDPQTLEMHANAGWTTGFFGYVRAGYESVANDPNLEFVGRNDGFILHHARLGHRGHNAASNLSYQVSFEGASDIANGINTPQGHLDVRLRDAFVRWDPSQYVGVQVGQFRGPLIGEELRGNSALLFVGRAVGIDGVAAGRGFQQAGLSVDRQIGVMISPAKPIAIAGDVSASYYLMAANGNGANQSLDDNGKPAFVGRVEVSYGDIVTLGGGAMLNPRTEGTLPNLIEEDDLTIAADLLVTVAGAEVFGQFVQRTTSYETIGATDDRKQQSIHAQIGYEIPTCIPLVPAYRFAMFNPWANADDMSDSGPEVVEFLKAQKLAYHTVGLRVIHPQRELGLSLYLNYTFTGEETARELENDRFEALVQLLF